MQEKDLCIYCDKKLIVVNQNPICEECQMLFPKNMKSIQETIDYALALREEKSGHLYYLEKTQMKTPLEITDQGKEELELWTHHNSLYGNLSLYEKTIHGTEEHRKMYFSLLYQYDDVVKQIKRFYQKQIENQ